MTCREFIDFISEYLNGSLSPSQNDSFTQHMEKCTDCVEYLKSFNKAIELGKMTANDDEVPSDVPLDLLDAILQSRKPSDQE